MLRAVLAVLVLFLTSTAASAAPKLEFLGEEILPTGLQFDATEVGGLSSIAYDADARRLLRPLRRPERHRPGALLHASPSTSPTGTSTPGDVVITDVTTLLDGAGLPFAARPSTPRAWRCTRTAS